MPRLFRSLTLKPQRLPADERDRLTEQLFALHARIFAGGDRETFRRQIIETGARDSTLRLQQNRVGETVGYCALHLYEIEHDMRTTGVVRIQAGLLPGYRRHNSMMPFALWRVLRHRLRHPLRPLYFFGTLVHPSSYALCAKYTRIWPAPTAALSRAGLDLLASCRRHFLLQAVDPARPLVVNVGWRTRDDVRDRAHWQRSARPAVHFFLRENPGYADGDGLMTLVALAPTELAACACKLAGDRLRRAWRRLTMRAPA